MLRKALNGKEKLWVVFWVYYIGLGLLLSIFGVFMLFISGNLGLMTVLGLAVWVTWMWFSAVTIWRNAENASSHFFGLGAKIIFILWPILGISYELWQSGIAG